MQSEHKVDVNAPAGTVSFRVNQEAGDIYAFGGCLVLSVGGYSRPNELTHKDNDPGGFVSPADHIG